MLHARNGLVLSAQIAMALHLGCATPAGRTPEPEEEEPSAGMDDPTPSRAARDARLPSTPEDAGTPGQAAADAAGTSANQDALAPPGPDGGNAPADAGPPASVGACRHPICEGFETYAAGVAPGGIWTRTEYGPRELKVDGSKAFSGKNAMLFRATAPTRSMRATIETSSKLPLTGGNLMWGRMMVWWDQMPQRGVHWDMIEGRGSGRMYRWGGMFGLMANYFPGDCYKHDTATVPTGRWVCVEWEFNGPRDEMRLYFDGNKVAEMIKRGSCDFRAPAVFDKVSIGWMHHQNTQRATSMWVDDVAIDNQRIGCPSR